MQVLRAEYAEADKVLLCERLKGALAGEADTSYAAIAAELGMTEGAVKQAAHRLRQRYRDILRRQIAQTVADQAEIDDEIRRLFEALRHSRLAPLRRSGRGRQNMRNPRADFL